MRDAHRCWSGLCLLAILAAFPVADLLAQAQSQDPPGPFVIDVRGATMGLPEDVGFYPPLPDGTLVAARGFGVEAGGHFYFGRLGASRLGAGASVAVIRGTTSDTSATARVIAPQLSFNFGTADGWSYLSGGVGAAHVEGRFTGGGEEASRRSDALLSLNFGGGARWFVNPHFGVGFDLRVHHIGGQDAKVGLAGTPSSWLLLASAGLSLK